jgi:hypothetical protein
LSKEPPTKRKNHPPKKIHEQTEPPPKKIQKQTMVCTVSPWRGFALDDSGHVLGVVACSCWILFGVRGRGFVIKDSGTVAAVLSMIQA